MTKEKGPAGNGPQPNNATDPKPNAPSPIANTTSRAVSWWSVHEYVAPILEHAGDWPLAGTVAWCQLADDDPVKWAALLDAARHWALRVETCQQAAYETSRDISAAADWQQIAQEIQHRREVYIPREVA